MRRYVSQTSSGHDLILLDIGLPVLNGYEVCRIIREQPWGAGITIVAMTGWGDQEAQRKVNEAGFDRHMVKPVDETLAALGTGAAGDRRSSNQQIKDARRSLRPATRAA